VKKGVKKSMNARPDPGLFGHQVHAAMHLLELKNQILKFNWNLTPNTLKLHAEIAHT
jgi:hypothetical protein